MRQERTYARRPSGLKRLLDDVQSGAADFTTILVYDVSRWGRFQNADESGYHEHICTRAGITVQYCAEQFENDGSLGSTIFKTVKRAMAGEYSRELSVKVFAGQCRLIERGFRQGGPPGYGLRRQLIDQSGAAKGELGRGEHKSLQTDRVILIPGPPEEVRTVRWMYRTFVEGGRTEAEIAAMLNARGTLTDLGRPWTRGTVHQVLINEKYIGNNVWNRAPSSSRRSASATAPTCGSGPTARSRPSSSAACSTPRRRSSRHARTGFRMRKCWSPAPAPGRARLPFRPHHR